MRLRKPCKEHGKYDAHLLLNGRETTARGIQMYLLNGGDSSDITVCPGGEFEREIVYVCPGTYFFPCVLTLQPGVTLRAVTDALASQVGESE